MEALLNLPDQSRLWMYAANREMNFEECQEINKALQNFTQHWTSHDMPIQAGAVIWYNRIILIAANESFQSVSGCGIDKSVKLMKDLGAQFGIDFFNRLQILVKQNNGLTGYTKDGLQKALDTDELNEQSLVFNPMVQTLGDFREKGFVPLHQFWMAKQLKFAVKY